MVVRRHIIRNAVAPHLATETIESLGHVAVCVLVGAVQVQAATLLQGLRRNQLDDLFVAALRKTAVPICVVELRATAAELQECPNANATNHPWVDVSLDTPDDE